MSALDTKRRVMPLGERERFVRDIQSEEADAKGEFPEVSRGMKKHLYKVPGMNGAGNQILLNRKKKALASGQPEEMTDAEVVALEKKDREMQEWFRPRMVCQEDVALRPSKGGVSDPDFARAVNFMAKNEHSEEFRRKAAEWKNIRRRMRPDDPQAGNLEEIRPKRGEAGAA